MELDGKSHRRGVEPRFGHDEVECGTFAIVTTQLPGFGAVLGGDFRIERQLGAGGMGAVYVAEQLSTGRRRALKLMHPSLVSDARLRERFEQEARVGARIQSDHVVQVIAAGIDEATGSPFIAMELLDGEDLATTIARRGALPPSDVRAILQPVCHALGAAHAVGIVHRDLKPENIFLLHTQDVQRSFDVKLLDFGIAKLTADARTMATSAVGTPLWMAPEQTDPRAKIAPTADVWPLGLLVFMMLTGRSYWRVANESGVSVQALMREILFEHVDAPSVRAVELGIDVPLPVGFDAWFLQCLDRDAARRFPTAKEAWESLVPVLGAEVREPARLAALARASGDATDRVRLEMEATAPVSEMAPTVPAPGLSGMEATVDASKLAIAASGHSTSLSVGQTVPTATPPRSNWRTIGAIAAVALMGVVSWQVATSRAERKNAVAQESTMAPRSSSETALPVVTNVGSPPSSDVAPATPSVAVAPPEVAPDAPLSSSSASASVTIPKKTAPPKPKLAPFDAAAAQRNLEMYLRTTKHICRQMVGPRSFSVTLTFAPSGHTVKVRANVPMPDASSTCAENVLRAAVVGPFDPASGNGVSVVAILLD